MNILNALIITMCLITYNAIAEEKEAPSCFEQYHHCMQKSRGNTRKCKKLRTSCQKLQKKTVSQEQKIKKATSDDMKSANTKTPIGKKSKTKKDCQKVYTLCLIQNRNQFHKCRKKKAECLEPESFE